MGNYPACDMTFCCKSQTYQSDGFGGLRGQPRFNMAEQDWQKDWENAAVCQSDRQVNTKDGWEVL